MQLNLFGVLWIGLLFFSLFKPQKLMGKLYLISFIFQANCAFIIGTQAINLSIITGCFLILKVLITEKTIKNTKTLRSWTLFLIIAIVISLISTYCFKGIEIFAEYKANGVNELVTKSYDGTTGVYRFVILFVYIFATCMLPQAFKEVSFDEFIKLFKIMLNIVLIVGIVQYIIVLYKFPIYKIYELLLTTDTTAFQTLAYYFKTPRLFSTFIEPSYCATFLSASFWCCLLSNKRYNLNKYLPIILIEILLTMSTTAYVALVLGAIVYLYAMKDVKALRNVILIGVLILFIITISGTYNQIYSIIFEKSSTNSGLTRSSWNKMAWKNFLDSKGIGMGYRTIRASSMLFNILGQLGILGMISFIYSIWQSCKKCVKTLLEKFESKFAIIFLGLVIISQLISCPDMDNSVLWLAISICVFTTSYIRRMQIQNNTD